LASSTPAGDLALSGGAIVAHALVAHALILLRARAGALTGLVFSRAALSRTSRSACSISREAMGTLPMCSSSSADESWH
jgi:hypothetical protein